MTTRRETVSSVAGVLAAALLVIGLVTWAASIGPSAVLRGDGLEPVRVTPSATTSPESASGSPRVGDGDRAEGRAPDGVGTVLRTLAVLLELAAAALGLFLLYRLGRWSVQAYAARRRPEAPPGTADVDVDPLEAPALAERIVRDAVEQRRLLTTGVPSNAIVACWHRFETQAAAAGHTRRPWETSSEFTLRILERAEADPAAVARLAALYREARFSEHPMTESDRQAAVQALDRLHGGLRRPVAGRAR